MNLLLRTICCALIACAATAAEHAAPAAATAHDASIPGLVVPAPAQAEAVAAVHSPDLYELTDRKSKTVKHHITSTFYQPASDIAHDVNAMTWLSVLAFIPFLILPLVLLLYIVYKFKDKGDGRKPATFRDHHTLEIVWTAIPCVALVVAGVPMWNITWKMELPPTNTQGDTIIEVRGKSFAWDYNYQQLGPDADYHAVPRVEIGVDTVASQEPMVLCKDRRTILNMTSNDVNHAWWIPAFGVKKDCIAGRYTNVWFTPTKTGFFKGACAELCGQGHGIMVISAVVLEKPEFDLWVAMQAHKADANKVWKLVDDESATKDQLEAAAAAFLGAHPTAERRFALAYWPAYHAMCKVRRVKDYDAAGATSRRAVVEAAADRIAARTIASN